MRKWIIAFFVGGVMGTAFGVAVGFFIFPYVFPPPPAMETLTAEEQTDVVAQGMFIHANPSDPIHYGEGNVTVYEDLVFLEEDFKVGPGPAFRVYLGTPTAEEKFVNPRMSRERCISISASCALRAFEGSQKYPIPKGVDLKNYPSVVIWCVQFGVLISPADLALES